MLHPVLAEDWTDYESRKIQDHRNPLQVSCNEPWEIIYITQKLIKYFPHKSERDVQNAIHDCGSEDKFKPRAEFIASVVQKLSE